MENAFGLKRIFVVMIVAFVSGAFLFAAERKAAVTVTGTALDIVGFYAFQSPANADNMVFVINTHGFITPALTDSAKFDTNVMLEINIDNSDTKDAVEDLVIQITFDNKGVQVYGPIEPIKTGRQSTLVATAKNVQGDVSAYGATVATIGNSNGMQVFAGPRDEPFFFDSIQYKNVIATPGTSFNNPGTDTYKGVNVMSVVVEVPKTKLGSGSINTWVTSNYKIIAQ